ncbi:MAG: RNA 2',3'-cyclic phosphodiesterase [Gammaproteobacteria bacterium]
MSRLRLFFALWPDDRVRDALWASAEPLRRACRGRPVAKRNLHATLVFLGGLDEARLPEVEGAAGSVEAGAFCLRFDAWGRFQRAGVAWLGCRRPDPAAAGLATALTDAMEGIGLAPERRPFRPHVTVLRKCRDGSPDEPVAPVDWPLSEFWLVQSRTLETGPVYEPLKRWPLAQET